MRRIERAKKIAGGGVVALLLVASTALGSTVLRFSADDLADRATIIVHGKVVGKQARRLSKGVIVTNYSIQVTEAFHGGLGLKAAKAKGKPLEDLGLKNLGLRGKVFTFASYGGVTPERGSGISGAASYSKDEEILVFLTGENKIGCRAAVGLAQGKFTIRLVEGKRLAFRDLEGLRLMDRKSGVIEETKAEQGVAFDSLLAGVKRRLAKNKTKQGK
ncbi:MAG: hypothetical protein JKY65_23515 [Planctomycetes bacterium]|nr:hypothetical protein [Planctomycetota bacterium]